MRHRFNLSDWSLRHRNWMLLALAALLIAGIQAYFQLPQREDPDFTFKVAMVRVAWPGATAQQVEQQLTAPLEQTLRDLPGLDSTSSYSHAHEAVLFVTLKDDIAPAEVAASWRALHQRIDKLQLPKGAAPPEIDDHFGTTYAVVCAFTTDDPAQLELIPQEARNKISTLQDVAKVELIGTEGTNTHLHIDGQHATGIAVAMKPDSDLYRFAEDIRLALRQLRTGHEEITLIANQARVVERSIDQFMRALLEALAIVLAVSFLSLGARAGLVVALSIPIVLALTFLLMKLFGIALHRVSVGALIIAIGLLVDDAMIAVEMMVVKLEQGWSKTRAAVHAFHSTAFPMLTGTLVTAAAFLPVGLAKSSAGEYTAALCAVVGIALLVSWIVAVMVTPLLGYGLLREHAHQHVELYQGRIYTLFRNVVVACLRFRKTVIAATLLMFAFAVFSFSKIEQQFFPPSDRPELLLDVWLPEGTPLAMTENAVQQLEVKLKSIEGIQHISSYIGRATPRFYLMMDIQPATQNYAQLVIQTADLAARERVIKQVRKLIDRDYPNFGLRIARLENGPPVGYPLQFRMLGDDFLTLDQLTDEVMQLVEQDSRAQNVSRDEMKAPYISCAPPSAFCFSKDIIYHLNSQRVLTVRADVGDGVDAAAVSSAIDAKLAALRAKLPQGYRIETGGVLDDSDQATESVIAQLPLVIVLILMLLWLQLRRFGDLLLVLLTAPLGLIGISAILLPLHIPFGFVAMLGMISLAGMILRNSVILVDQIEQDLAQGLTRHQAIVDSTVRRARPILLTAAAAMLAMIPLVPSVFWGPMALTIMGGLFSATLLTLLFLPALYAAWYRVETTDQSLPVNFDR